MLASRLRPGGSTRTATPRDGSTEDAGLVEGGGLGFESVAPVKQKLAVGVIEDFGVGDSGAGVADGIPGREVEGREVEGRDSEVVEPAEDVAEVRRASTGTVRTVSCQATGPYPPSTEEEKRTGGAWRATSFRKRRRTTATRTARGRHRRHGHR